MLWPLWNPWRWISISTEAGQQLVHRSVSFLYNFFIIIFSFCFKIYIIFFIKDSNFFLKMILALTFEWMLDYRVDIEDVKLGRKGRSRVHRLGIDSRKPLLLIKPLLGTNDELRGPQGRVEHWRSQFIKDFQP